MTNKGSEYNAKREIAHRMDRLDRAVRGEQIERSKMFKDYNITESKLNARIEMLNQRKAANDHELDEAIEQLETIRENRRELGFEHEVIITEHAYLRYVQRYMGIDIEEIHRAILKLPKKDVTKYGNTIVTVYPLEDEDNRNYVE